jgi:hypothetical protein
VREDRVARSEIDGREQQGVPEMVVQPRERPGRGVEDTRVKELRGLRRECVCVPGVDPRDEVLVGEREQVEAPVERLHVEDVGCELAREWPGGPESQRDVEGAEREVREEPHGGHSR